MYQITFYVPQSHVEIVKTAMFGQGAGRIGDYSCCAWQTQGEGQFFPEEGSQPYAGQLDKISHEKEYKVEMVCEDAVIVAVLEALMEAHPYEEPAYAAYKILTLKDVKDNLK